jgi:DNA processing protein
MDLRDLVAIARLPGASRMRLATLVRRFGPVPPPIGLREAAVLMGLDLAEAVLREASDSAGRCLESAAASGCGVVWWWDPRYPSPLAAIPDPPVVLWTRGAPEALGRAATVAIVGSRAASAYALEVAGRLAGDLAAHGVVVVSGLARGVDGAAHRGCLAAGGTTVAVLGSGIDRIYPPEHAGLAQQAAAAGVVISELPPGTAPLPEYFPQRNRIISGLSQAVVVVEASEKSGSLITARCGLEQGREVMAVPGSVLSGRNRGSHALLKDGAKVVESADDILEELRLPVSGGDEAARPPGASNSLADALVPGEVYSLDALVQMTGVSAPKLLPRLLDLELQGRIARAGGGGFVRRGGKW